jgi:Ni/Co efflux regulator RcnB
MKSFGKLVFCIAALGAIAPAFALDPPRGGPPGQDRRDDRHDDRDDRQADRRDWHDDRGNHRGPPPHARSWQRGHRYDGRVIIVNDYRVRHLREPPRGYHWVRDDDSDQYLLVAIATGIILDIATR